MTSDLILKYHDTGATVERDDQVLHAYGWPKEGGHVWKIADSRSGPYRQQVCYHGSVNTIMTEDSPRSTAAHIAELYDIPADRILPRWA